MPRAIIDTNIWISALMKSTLSRPVLTAFIEKRFQPVVSDELMRELNRVLNEPAVSKLVNKEEAKELITLIDEKSHKIKAAVKTNICRDPQDNFLISLLIESKAPLVTLDKDLLVLSKELRILSPTEFLNQL